MEADSEFMKLFFLQNVPGTFCVWR